MNYVNFIAGGNEYKLRLTTRSLVELEKLLGCSPLMIFGTDPNNPNIPGVEAMVEILYASAKSKHEGFTLEKAYDVFDAYLEDGNAVTDFLGVLTEIYNASGLINTKSNKGKKDAAPKN